MSITKLRALIKLATSSPEPGEAESAALQACRYIQEHSVELKLPDAPAERVSKAKDHDIQHRATERLNCDGCEDTIEPGDLYWFRPGPLITGPHRRYHGGCV